MKQKQSPSPRAPRPGLHDQPKLQPLPVGEEWPSLADDDVREEPTTAVSIKIDLDHKRVQATVRYPSARVLIASAIFVIALLAYELHDSHLAQVIIEKIGIPR